MKFLIGRGVGGLVYPLTPTFQYLNLFKVIIGTIMFAATKNEGLNPNTMRPMARELSPPPPIDPPVPTPLVKVL